jgi:tetratricopeptide (TPR) repeat protein
MPLIRIDSAEALKNIKDNSVGRWPRRDEPGRLSPIAKPQFKPSFSLKSGDTIFTIGSCFARHVERELGNRGFQLPTRKLFESDEDFGAVGLDVLNNYGTPSIYNELAWAFDENFDPNICFHPVRDSWVDMHLHTSIRPTSLDVLVNRRRAIRTAYRSITECRAVIITLGMAEVWYDTERQLYLNVAPRRTILREEPGRFELHVLSLDESYSYLRRALELIRKHGRPGIKVLLTVSPVPLSGTYRDADVMLANTYSKSVLRVAAEQAAVEFAFVDYFPSYESVTLSERDHAWTEDNVHVTHEAVDVNVGRMVQAYTKSETLDKEGVRERLRELRGNRSAIFRLLEDRTELLDDPELANAYADAALSAGRLKLARMAMERFAIEPVLAARIHLALSNPTEALKLLESVTPKAGNRSNFYGTKMRALLALARIDEATTCANDWIAADRTTPQPYLLLARESAADPQKAIQYYELAVQRCDKQPSAVVEYADYLVRTGRVAEARDLVRGVDPNHPFYRRRKEEIMSLVGSSRRTPRKTLAPAPHE